MQPMMGSAHVYGDHVNSDLIIPTPCLRPDVQEMGRYCFITHDPEFIKRVRPGDIVVAGVNFGCGSTKPAANTLLAAGIVCVVASSFGRVFFRNAINAGLLVVPCPALVEATKGGDAVRIDFDNNLCENITRGQIFPFEPYPALIGEIIQAGGIVNMVHAQRQAQDRLEADSHE